MITRWQWIFLQFARRLWVRAAMYATLGVAAALVAVTVERTLPDAVPFTVGADAVEGILRIIASSMLAVTTFSLSVMVAAYSAATTSVTPRATRLLMQDPTTHNALAAFIGSFLFSLVGLVALSTGVYGVKGRVVLFVVTLAVIALIVVTLLQWIDHLSRLGRVGETTERVEKATLDALRDRMEHPALGGVPLDVCRDSPHVRQALYADRVGYVQHIDMEALQACAADCGPIFVDALPGIFVHRTRALASTERPLSDETAESVRKAFTIDAERSFDQDPRYGFCVLSEIASRALSPAINDPGTAIDVIGRVVRLFDEWRDQRADEIQFSAVHVQALRADDVFDDVFNAIARDGAAMIEVQVRLQKALLALARTPALRGPALRHSKLAAERAVAALSMEEERATVRELAALVASSQGSSPRAAAGDPSKSG